MSRLRSLSGADAFRRVFQQGRKARRDGITVAAAPGAAGAGVRIGFTVGRRVGPATVRNIVKRRLRMAFRAAQVGGDVDVVVRVDKEVSSKSYASLEADLRAAVTAALPDAP